MNHGVGEGEIGMDAMTRSIELIRLLIDHALFAFDGIGSVQTSDDIRAVQNGSKKEVNLRSIRMIAIGFRMHGLRLLES
tara:strand:- start:396 stop:632 length:237 start_codon:yes stop_codon:yes gene_type:complete